MNPQRHKSWMPWKGRVCWNGEGVWLYYKKTKIS